MNFAWSIRWFLKTFVLDPIPSRYWLPVILLYVRWRMRRKGE